MPTLARFRRQRLVNRGSWKAPFTRQRVNTRGSTSGTALTTPTLTSIAPTTNTAAGAAFTVTCTGTNFVAGITRATVNLKDRYTTVVSPTSVTFSFPRPAAAGTYSVNVHNGQKFSTTPQTLTIT